MNKNVNLTSLYSWDNHISPRIKELVKHIPQGSRIADVGCDHGFLIYEAFKENKITSALAIDNKIGPLRSALVHLAPSTNLTYSLSSGLSDVDDTIDTIIMAGMGGHLIGELLQEYPEKICGKRFIFSPQHKAQECREVFNSLSIKIIDENMYEFAGQTYTIIDAIGEEEPVSYTPFEIEMGPIFLKKKPDLWVKSLEKEKHQLESIAHIEAYPLQLSRLNHISLALKTK